MALFLASTKNDRKIVVERMRIAYDLRSTVAHGGRYKKHLPKKGDGTVPTMDEFVWQIQEYVRIAIIKNGTYGESNQRLRKFVESGRTLLRRIEYGLSGGFWWKLEMPNFDCIILSLFGRAIGQTSRQR
jgi:hypothetical protein